MIASISWQEYPEIISTLEINFTNFRVSRLYRISYDQTMPRIFAMVFNVSQANRVMTYELRFQDNVWWQKERG